VFYGTVRPVAWMDLSSGARMPADAFAGKAVFSFCGLGNPESFRQTLIALGCSIAAFRTYADHHPYTEADIVEILASSNSHPVVTTEKDAVRLPRPLGFALLIEADVPGLPDFARCNSVLTSV
jgi:tetraacyldisaccharide-1-P 4'-kinase